MDRINIPQNEGGVPHRVYDLSIVDVKERQAKSKVYPSILATANYLGVGIRKVEGNRQRGKQIYSEKHNKSFAVRIEHEKKVTR